MEINKDEYVPVVNEEQAKAEVLKYLHSREIYVGSRRYKALKGEIETLEMMVMEGAISFDFEQEKMYYKNAHYHETFIIPFRMVTGIRKRLDKIDRDKMFTASIILVSIVVGIPEERLEKLDYQIIEDISVIIPFL